jgi:hypothetical protein
MKFIVSRQKFLLSEANSEQEFSFSELSPEVQSKVLDKYGEEYHDYLDPWWYEDVVSNFESNLEDLGLENIECNFTGFWSQGDGASFTGGVRDVEKFFKEAIKLQPGDWFEYSNTEPKIKTKEEEEAEEIFIDLGIWEPPHSKALPDDFSIKIERNSFSRYYHENTIAAELDVDEPLEGRGLTREQNREFIKWLESLSDQITVWARAKSKELYSELEQEYSSLTSEEAIREWLKEKDYKFTKDGVQIE